MNHIKLKIKNLTLYLSIIIFSLFFKQSYANTLDLENLNNTNIKNHNKQPLKIIDGLTQQEANKYEQRNKNNLINFTTQHNLFPKISFLDSKNQLINIKDMRGKILIIHFWASWCGHCMEEMIDLNNFAQILHQYELDDQIKIIPISIDQNIEHAYQFYQKYQINHLDLFSDPQSFAFTNQLGLSALPHSFIISQYGKQIYQIRGSIQWSKNPNMLNELKNQLTK